MSEQTASIIKISGWKSFSLGRFLPGKNFEDQLRLFGRNFGIPAVTVAIFLAVWGMVAPQIKTSLGEVPGPAQVWGQVQSLAFEYRQEAGRRREFAVKEKERAAKLRAENPGQAVKARKYSGR